jgi:predicted hotdog family 3-hydroxylacyl-ACP dehydratase
MSEVDLSRQLKQLAGMSASEFVLHREPMLLLDRLVDVGAEFAVCEWKVCDRVAFISPGVGVPTYVGVEYMAQCVAVHAGACARARGLAPPLGFLLGTRHYKAITRYFDLGATYRATCRELIKDDQGMGAFECRILLDDKIVAEGRLAVLQKRPGKKMSE